MSTPLIRTLISRPKILGEGSRISASRLAYKIGQPGIYRAARKSQKGTGDKFDIRWFHRCVLENGSMPLSVLEKHVDWCIKQKANLGSESKAKILNLNFKI